MGNSAGTLGQGGMGLPGPAPGPAPGKSRYRTWQKFGGLRAAHMATVRMQGRQADRLWKSARSEREPWKTLLLQARDELDAERQAIRRGAGGVAGQGGARAESSRADRHSVMHGEAAGTHLKRNAREVWVFISSTFTDMKLERNLLMEDVYPFVREYARLIGLSFNAVDMRWGIRQTVCDAHMASEICLDEVERCRENSVGPFFVCILGQKYGYRPIPYRLPQATFELLIGHIGRQADTDDKQADALRLIKEWFRLDTNSAAFEYIMQPIAWKFPDHNEDPEQRDGWWAEFCAMRAALFAAVERVVRDADSKREVLRSITEGEIARAIGGGHPPGHSRFHFFSRSFAGLNRTESGAKHYVDWDGDRVDSEAQVKLEHLTKSIGNTVREDRFEKYNLHFSPSADTMFNDERNKEKLRHFLDRFCDYLVKSIHQGAVNLSSALDDPLYSEVISHNIFCRERADFFAGREKLIGSVVAYLNRPHGDRPFVVHGCGGSGKSSLLAKVISRSLESWTGCDLGRPVHLVRFIAITPHSSNIRDLLYFICLQLSYCLNLDLDSVPIDYKLLEIRFHQLLAKATAEKPFMIFLDSLDQLSNENEGRDLHWLRPVLPKHVHLIVTIRPNAGGALSAMKNLVKHEESYLEVRRLDEQDQNSLLEMMLSKAGRRLQPDQKRLVLNAHHDNDPTPLFTRLAGDIAMRWRSYTPTEECRLADSTPGLIRQLFKQLEIKHGEIFVGHALGYLTASASGLSASELIDLLSCDDVVLDDIFQYHIPPIRRLPPLLWTRLRLDLGDYLVEGGVDNSVVYRWYHRLFYETARQMYLESSALLHQALAMYFLGRWADTPKPYTEKDSGQLAVAHRRVQSQPLILNAASVGRQDGFADVGAAAQPKAVHWNLRKLTELPRHLVRGNLWEECEIEMCSIPWLEAKCRTGRIYKLLLELAEAADKTELTGNKLKDFYRMVRSNVTVIQQYPELICQQALNEPDSSTCSNVAKDYLAVRGKHMFTWLDLSKDQNEKAEIMTLTHTAPVRLVQFSHNCKYLATACQDRTIRVWRVASGALEVTAEAEPIKMAFPTHCHWLAVLEKTGVHLLGLGQGGHAKGKFVLQIPMELEPQAGVYIPKTNRHIYVVALGRLSVYSASDGKLVQKKELKCRPKAVAFTSGGKLLAIAYRDVHLWDMAKETDTKHFETENLKSPLNNCNLQFSADGRRLMGVLPNGTYRWAVRGNNAKAQGHKLSLTCQAGPSAVSKNLDFVATLSGESDLKVLRLQPSLEWCLLQGHRGPVLAADFGETRSEDELLATGSQDCTVRIWDTASITRHITVQSENHNGAVDGCVYADDGRLAATSSPADLYHLVWSVTTTPPKVTHHLQSLESCKPGKVLCMSANFVVSSCNGNDFDIWNLKSPPLKTDNMVIKGIHRLLPYVNPHLIFVVFRQALLACFTTSNRPGVLYGYEVLPAAALADWLRTPAGTPAFQSYSQDVREFKHGADSLVPAAALNADCSRLVTLSFKMTDEQMMSSTVHFDRLDYRHTAPQFNIWDVRRQHLLRKYQLDNSVGRLHQLAFLRDKCVMFYQKKVREGASRSGPKVRGQSSGEAAAEMVVLVIGVNSEGLLKTVRMPGAYDKMLVPEEGYVDPGRALDKQLEGVVLNSVTPDGVLSTSRVGAGQPVGQFKLQVARVTSYAFSPDNQTAVVGFDSGYVHFLRMYNAVGKNYYQ